MKEQLEQIGSYGIVPVIEIEDSAKAISVAKALCAGGLPIAEVTFRTDCAKEAITLITRELPNMMVGAGTILTCEQVDDAVEAGAKFIVSPGLNPNVVKHSIERGIPVIPGCSSPSDIEVALGLGLDTVKFFPAEAAGGLAMIKAMAAPYGNLKFMPTGGIHTDNLMEYLSFPKILACGGSFMVKKEWIQKGEFAKITAQTKQTVLQIMGFELAHIGINCENNAQAQQAALLVSTMFGFMPVESEISIFCGKEFEFMKTPYLGKMGHIAIATNFLGRAIAYFKRMGLEFNQESKKFDKDGHFKAIYFQEEIAGFAIHLVQKTL